MCYIVSMHDIVHVFVHHSYSDFNDTCLFLALTAGFSVRMLQPCQLDSQEGDKSEQNTHNLETANSIMETPPFQCELKETKQESDTTDSTFTPLPLETLPPGMFWF